MAAILAPVGPVAWHQRDARAIVRPQFGRRLAHRAAHAGEAQIATEEALIGDARHRVARSRQPDLFLGLDQLMQPALPRPVGHHRSAEQTSELQSLMRNSYAVLRLKKKI